MLDVYDYFMNLLNNKPQRAAELSYAIAAIADEFGGIKGEQPMATKVVRNGQAALRPFPDTDPIPAGEYQTPDGQRYILARPKSRAEVVQVLESQHLAPKLVSFLRSLKPTKALNEQDATEGGALVPAEITTQLVTNASIDAIVRPRATILPMTRRELTVPTFDLALADTTGGLSLAWTAESASITSDDPALAVVRLIANGLKVVIEVSNEWLEDALMAEAVLQTAFARGIKYLEDKLFLAADGTGKPMGILIAPATLAVNRAGGGNAFDPADARAMRQKLHTRARRAASCAWVMNPGITDSLLQFSGWQPNGPYELHGFPILESPHLSVPGTAGDVLLCDFSHYLIGDRELRIAASPHPRFSTAITCFRLVYRVDGQPGQGQPTTEDDGVQRSPFVMLS